ncbi:GPP34 family phosphoprotein [Micromonospora sp. RV43]|uniref:GOLPH3/VPS74 family protein n=1 Tax=Micromonospora sp. RV43 TaxID=1661387 RepID=UPI00069FFEAA|nr:GPP34 family phosphoprotein [Micromonospora sp. RV43]
MTTAVQSAGRHHYPAPAQGGSEVTQYRLREPQRGPTLLADEFWLICHDDRDGKPRLNDLAIRFGLAAALLGELAVASRITFERGHVIVYDATPPVDPLQHFALNLLVKEEATQTRDWLIYFAESAYGRVAERLHQAHRVTPEERRRFLGVLGAPTTLWKPVDTNDAGWSWLRLHRALRNFEPLDNFDLALVGFADATGLAKFIVDGYPSAGRHLQALLEAAPPPMRDLLDELSAAIGAAVLAP